MGTPIMTKKNEEDNPANRSCKYINTPYIECYILHISLLCLHTSFFEGCLFKLMILSGKCNLDNYVMNSWIEV